MPDLQTARRPGTGAAGSSRAAVVEARSRGEQARAALQEGARAQRALEAATDGLRARLDSEAAARRCAGPSGCGSDPTPRKMPCTQRACPIGVGAPAARRARAARAARAGGCRGRPGRAAASRGCCLICGRAGLDPASVCFHWDSGSGGWHGLSHSHTLSPPPLHLPLTESAEEGLCGRAISLSHGRHQLHAGTHALACIQQRACHALQSPAAPARTVPPDSRPSRTSSADSSPCDRAGRPRRRARARRSGRPLRRRPCWRRRPWPRRWPSARARCRPAWRPRWPARPLRALRPRPPGPSAGRCARACRRARRAAARLRARLHARLATSQVSRVTGAPACQAQRAVPRSAARLAALKGVPCSRRLHAAAAVPSRDAACHQSVQREARRAAMPRHEPLPASSRAYSNIITCFGRFTGCVAYACQPVRLLTGMPAQEAAGQLAQREAVAARARAAAADAGAAAQRALASAEGGLAEARAAAAAHQARRRSARPALPALPRMRRVQREAPGGRQRRQACTCASPHVIIRGTSPKLGAQRAPVRSRRRRAMQGGSEGHDSVCAGRSAMPPSGASAWRRPPPGTAPRRTPCSSRCRTRRSASPRPQPERLHRQRRPSASPVAARPGPGSGHAAHCALAAASGRDRPPRPPRSAAASAQAAAAAELAAQRRAGSAAAAAAAAAAGAELEAAAGAGARERGAWAAERERAAAEAADLGRRLADGAAAAAEWQRLARQLEADRLQQAPPEQGGVPGGVGCGAGRGAAAGGRSPAAGPAFGAR